MRKQSATLGTLTLLLCLLSLCPARAAAVAAPGAAQAAAPGALVPSSVWGAYEGSKDPSTDALPIIAAVTSQADSQRTESPVTVAVSLGALFLVIALACRLWWALRQRRRQPRFPAGGKAQLRLVA